MSDESNLMKAARELLADYVDERSWPDNLPVSLVARLRTLASAVGEAPAPAAPIPMLLHCPECRARHVDEGEFATKIHHTHSCQSCGLTWRPAVVPTVGVRFLPGFKNDASARPLCNCGGLDVEHRRESPGCEYRDHHCDACHAKGKCTTKACVGSPIELAEADAFRTSRGVLVSSDDLVALLNENRRLASQVDALQATGTRLHNENQALRTKAFGEGADAPLPPNDVDAKASSPIVPDPSPRVFDRPDAEGWWAVWAMTVIGPAHRPMLVRVRAEGAILVAEYRDDVPIEDEREVAPCIVAGWWIPIKPPKE